MTRLQHPGARFARLLCRFRGISWVDRLERDVRSFHRCLNNVDFDMTRNGEWRVLGIVSELRPACIFDVGANLGAWTSLASGMNPECAIHAFEIVPSTYEKLLAHTAGLPNVKPNDFGLADEDGVLKVMLGRSSSTSTAFTIPGLKHHDEYYSHSIECHVQRAQDYMHRNGIAHIDYVKIDTEGMDLKVIEGFGQRIADVRALQFEYGVFNIASRDLLVDFWNYLTQRGFVVGKIFPRYVDFCGYKMHMENFQGSNYVAVRDDEGALINRLQTRS